MEKYSKQRRKMALYILVIGYITFICYVLAESTIFTNYSGLHKWLYLPYDISLIVLPIWLLAWLYFALRSISLKSIKSLKSSLLSGEFIKTNSFKILSFLILLVLGLSLGYQVNSYTTTGCFTIEDKFEKGSAHYIVVNDVRIKCDKSTFDCVVEGAGYSLTYKGNTYTPNIGNLKNLDI